MSEILKLIESGAFTAAFKEMCQLGANTQKLMVSVKGTPAFAIIMVKGERETKDVQRTIEGLELIWDSEGEAPWPKCEHPSEKIIKLGEHGWCQKCGSVCPHNWLPPLEWKHSDFYVHATSGKDEPPKT